jgi:hypothetical protein
MLAFAPTDAASEGFRLLRREPAAAFVWMLLWLAAFLFTATVVARGDRVVVSGHGPTASLREIAQRFGPFAAVCIALFLMVWAMTTVAVYRAVLRPEDRRFFYLRLGADEMRLAVMTVTAFFLVLLFGGVPAYLLLVLADPLMRALPNLAREIATLGALATVCVDIWLGVRLSLIAVETFAERRFHLSAYWPLAKGRFWYLFFCYFLCFWSVLLLSFLLFFVGGVVTALAQPDAGVGNILRRTSVLGLATMLAVLTASFWVMSTVVLCACQAYAFRAILGAGDGDVTIIHRTTVDMESVSHLEEPDKRLARKRSDVDRWSA